VIRVVLDTNLYVGWLNRSLHPELFLGREYVRYLSSVVLMELRAGASTRRASTALDQLLRGYQGGGRLVAPPAQLFDRAGTILRRLRFAGRDVRRASFVHDVLIALTARAIGATLYTSDAGDFQAIREIERFALEIVTL
jgi:predicted nucleic acid-binding protein